MISPATAGLALIASKSVAARRASRAADLPTLRAEV